MNGISKRSGEIILAIAAVALLVGVVLSFASPIGNMFQVVINKEHEQGQKIFEMGRYDAPYTVKLASSIPNAGTVELTGEHTGANANLKGEHTLTFKATENPGYIFLGWYVGNTLISEDMEYTTGYPVNGNITITARYEAGLAPGLYNTNGDMIASWSTLTDTYGMDVTKNYTAQTASIDTTSPYYVLTNNAQLGDGINLIVGNVSSIGDYAFQNCKNLTSIKIRASVTTIGRDAFSGCSNLASVTFGDNSQLTTIGTNAFQNCTSLGSVTFGANSQLTTIGPNAFKSCTSLTSIAIPASVETIGSFAFSMCTGLASVTFGDNSQLTSIDTYAFQNCKNLTSITIPASVATIGRTAFNVCTGLTSATFENPNGWYVTTTSGAASGTDVTLTNTSTNATYLNSTYLTYYWYRK